MYTKIYEIKTEWYSKREESQICNTDIYVQTIKD